MRSPISESSLVSLDLADLARVRRRVAEIAAEAGFAQPRVFDITLVCSEAVANAIEHAPVKGQVITKIFLYADRLEIQVEGPGEFQTPNRLKEPGNRGLGLPLMAKLSDHLALYSAPQGGTLVSLVFYRAGYEHSDARSPLSRDLVELFETRERLESVLDAMPEGFTIFDKDWRCLYLNDAAAAHDRRPKDEILGRPLLESKRPYSALISLFERAQALGEAVREEVRHPLDDTWLELTAFPFASGMALFSRDITDRKEAEAAVRDTQERLSTVLENSRDGINMLDLETGRYVFMNPSQVELTGFSIEEINNISAEEAFERVHPDDREISMAQHQRVIAGEDSGEAVEYRWKVKSGEFRWFSDTRRAVRDSEGRPVALVGISRDITARKHAEDALRRSEEKYRTLFDSLDEGFCIIEVLFDEEDRAVDYRILETNQAYLTQTGRDDSVGRRGREMAPDLEEYWFETYGRVAKTRQPVRFQERVQALDRYLDVYAFPIGRPEECRVAVLFSDITERTRAEQTVREREERVNFALQISGIGAWDLDLLDHTARRSLEHDRIFGYESLLPEWSYEMFLDHVLPEDRAEVGAKFGAAVAARGDWSFECRIRRVDGAIRWIWAAGRHRMGEEGHWRLVGIVQDITERKQAEAQRQRLVEQEQEVAAGAYARRLIEASLDPLVAIGPDGKITDVNEATVRITGSTREELIGTDFSNYFTDPVSARRGYRRVFAHGSVSDYPLTIRDREGKLTDVLYNASVYRDQDGEVVGVFAAARDITAVKELKEQRDIASALQEALFDLPGQRDGIRFGHVYRSATEAARVGGDFYDVFEVKDGKIAVLIGDVSGHGVQAARSATLVKDVIHAFAHQSIRSHKVLRRANKLLIEKGFPGFVTLFLGILDTGTGRLHFSSAGHPETLLRRGSGEIERLGSGSSPLGIFADASWKPAEVDLLPGDVLVLYTDGVLEARRGDEFFGEARLERLARRKGASVERLPRLVVDQVLAFSGGTLSDDMAVVALMVTGPHVRSKSETVLG